MVGAVIHIPAVAALAKPSPTMRTGSPLAKDAIERPTDSAHEAGPHQRDRLEPQGDRSDDDHAEQVGDEHRGAGDARLGV